MLVAVKPMSIHRENNVVIRFALLQESPSKELAVYGEFVADDLGDFGEVPFSSNIKYTMTVKFLQLVPNNPGKYILLPTEEIAPQHLHVSDGYAVNPSAELPAAPEGTAADEEMIRYSSFLPVTRGPVETEGEHRGKRLFKVTDETFTRANSIADLF